MIEISLLIAVTRRFYGTIARWPKLFPLEFRSERLSDRFAMLLFDSKSFEKSKRFQFRGGRITCSNQGDVN